MIGSLIFSRLAEKVSLDECQFVNVVAASEGFVDNVAVFGNPDLIMAGDPAQRRYLEATGHSAFVQDTGA